MSQIGTVMLEAAEIVDAVVVFANFPSLYMFGFQRTWYRNYAAQQPQNRYRAGKRFFEYHLLVMLLALVALGFTLTIPRDSAGYRKDIAIFMALFVAVATVVLFLSARARRRSGKLSA